MKVNCEECFKEFKITPNRAKNKHHTCSTKCLGKLNSKLYSKKIKVPCSECGIDVFYKKSHIKEIANPTCSRNCSAKIRSKTTKNNNNPKSLGLSEFERVFWDRALDLKRRAKARRLEFNLDFEFLINLYKKQIGLCAYSGVPMILKGNSIKYNTMSVDRIVPEKGYVKDNVVLCCHALNMFKSNYSYDDVLTLIDGIYKTHQPKVKLKIKRLDKKATLPKYTYPGDAAIDLIATSKEYDEKHNCIVFGTGIALEIPEGFVGLIFPRSSIFKVPLMLSNHVGVLDANFRGEVKFMFRPIDRSSKNYEPGDRVGQLIILPYPTIEPEEAEELSETERGSGGFGSSGR